MPGIMENPAAAVAAANRVPRPPKDAVLPQICALALAGQSCRQLAATFGLTKSTVSRWLQELREDCPTRVAGCAEIIAHAVARYDTLYRKALEAWDLSQADKQTESVVEIETARGPKKKRTRRTESQAGAPVFLAEARRALDGIARIVARIAPRPGKAGVPLSGITAERDEYGGVPPRPSQIEVPRQELSHSGPMAGITAERDEYGGVPPRPSQVEVPRQELSHSGPMAGITAKR